MKCSVFTSVGGGSTIAGQIVVEEGECIGAPEVQNSVRVAVFQQFFAKQGEGIWVTDLAEIWKERIITLLHTRTPNVAVIGEGVGKGINKTSKILSKSHFGGL